MRPTISRKSFISLILILDFFISINFMYTYRIPWSGYVKIPLFLLAGIVMSFNRTLCASKRLKRFVGVFLFVILLESIYSTFKYKQEVSDVAKTSLSYLILLNSFVYYSYFRYYEDYKIFLNKLVAIVVSMQALLFVQAFLFNSGITSVQFLKELFSSEALNEFGAVHIRNGNLRCGQFHKYVYLVYFYSLYKMMNSKHSRTFRHTACVILTFINEIYVGQTRGSFTVFAAVTVLVVIVSLWNTKHEILLTIIICISVVAIICGNVLEILYSSFIESDIDTVSIRFQAIQYYMGLLKESPIMGIGIIYPIQGGRLDLWHLLYGPDLWHKFVYSDIGITGAIAQFGGLSIFLFIRLFFDMIHATHRCLIKKKMFLFAFGFTLYCLGTCTTLLITIDEMPLVLGVYAMFFVCEENQCA